MNYILLAVIKIVDNIISTFKNVYIYRGLKVLSSIMVIVSQLIFYLVIDQVIEDNTMKAIIIVSVASGIGNYIALLLDDKFKKDEKYTMFLTCSCIDDVKTLCSYLAENEIRYIVSDGYNKKGVKTLNVTAFSRTKDESRLIDKYLENTNKKYLKEVLK